MVHDAIIAAKPTTRTPLYMTVREFAQAAGLNHTTINRWVRLGKLAVYRDGKRNILRVSDLQRVPKLIEGGGR